MSDENKNTNYIVTLNWKAPSESKMADFVDTLDIETKKEFAKTCASKENGKCKINKSMARKWLTEKFDGTDKIKWENRPEKKVKKVSGAERICRWLDL